MKLKLIPSMKIKRRYIIFNTNNQEQIEQVILDSLGTLGWAKTSPVFIKDEGKLVLSVKSSSLDELRAALELSDKELKVLAVSGTLKGLRKR